MIKNFEDFLNESVAGQKISTVDFKYMKYWIEYLDLHSAAYLMMWNIIMAETSSWRNTMEKKQNTKMQLEPYIDDISYDHVEISGDDKDGSENISIEAIIEGLSGDDVYLIAEGDCKYSTTPYIAATRWDPPEGGELILEDIWCNELWLETIYHTNEPNILKTHFNENETGFSNKDFNHMCDVFIT